MAKMELSMDKLKLDLSVLGDDEFEKICLQEVETTISRLNDAVSRGKNADGKSLKGYSEKYKKKIVYASGYKGENKALRYLRKKAGHTSPANLRISNTLLGSRRAFRVDGGAEGRFNPARPDVDGSGSGITNVQLAGYLEDMGYTDWHAFGVADVRRINKRFRDEVGKALDRMIKVEKG